MPPLTGSITMESVEFRRELEQANNDLLAQRLKWYAIIRGGIGLLWILGDWGGRIAGRGFVMFDRYAGVGGENGVAYWKPAVIDTAWVAVYACTAWMCLTKTLGRKATLRLSILLVLADGLYGVSMKVAGIDPGAAGVPMLLVTHAIAAFLFPWTAWQAAQPVLIAGFFIAVRKAFAVNWSIESEIFGYGILILFLLLMPGPGMLIALLLHSRRTEQYRYRFLRNRYGRLREELAYARRIHESLFPAPRRSSDPRTVGFAYEYQPMRQIGGDFLYARPASELEGDEEDRRFSVVLLDVTGHGIPAALTVNRLQGELELMYAQNPAPEPAEVMRTLNHYVHLTLAKHSIYVTGACVRVDPDKGVVDYSNSGHPPLFLRAIDGTVRSMESTSFVLGACPGSAFDPGQKRLEFLPGDAIIAYTDGATEARNAGGRMLTLEGLRRLVAESRCPPPGGWCELLMRDVESHRAGHIEDDTLFVEIYLPAREVGTGASADPATAASSMTSV